MFIKFSRLRDMGFRVETIKGKGIAIEPEHHDPEAQEAFRTLCDKLHLSDRESDELMSNVSTIQVVAALRRM